MAPCQADLTTMEGREQKAARVQDLAPCIHEPMHPETSTATGYLGLLLVFLKNYQRR